jgi:hypothetical protein
VKPVPLLLVLACGHPPTTPGGGSGRPIAQPVDAGAPPIDAGPLDQDLDRLATRSLALFVDIDKAFTTAGEDCAAATTKLGELATAYTDVIDANAKVLHDGREMQLKIALRRHEDKFNASAKAVMESKTLAACWQDVTFARAFDRLAGKPD